ncbi:MAG: 30S ribosomal protein S2 [Candidatus Sulcia muelleri]|uniref:Small ribosomal subunit protein uS2 n=3 Tax=Candidatus Karelsulcia muelleri TaxID=336810 RepID=RS2_KARMG|nr:RecName: Full=Small ribosomal subunit protein uS2; AltName: Full=30S ribosomal protein S2 [Candidatus Karelsulcia muelleri GWSS]EAT14109.1 ribosomal protein S2 [Candidatus Karelsulcia muelleri str. Hc (Homalodisca coagulata)]MBS0018853.1 30S ribosomal protein S2 [Candidatus Karelsulcia muelleri]ABS30503.1 30S ribosomal subunit protein S2 [Candidatus Karelsulcia muelleri GWSS]MCJ7422467.1 30S ribosomal protein S2 [Candidatus Karelsulcia muelleri]MCJ7468795.1 30S ribosomal protein S2 [Candida
MYNIEKFIKVGAHFGHTTSKWNPNMRKYIFMKKGGIHIIDISKTIKKINEACKFIKNIVSSGKKILFVATKKQAKDIVSDYAKKVNMPYITERWLGGILTNMSTIRQSVKKMNVIDRQKIDGTYNMMSKKEKLLIDRLKNKLKKNIGSISKMNSLPACVIIVDVKKEKIAVKECINLCIPIIGIVDTNCDPRNIDYPIPANDDSSKSIHLIISYLTNSILTN